MIRPQTWAHARPILERLLALPLEEREPALLRECAKDNELRERLLRVLRAAERCRVAFEPARLDRIDDEELTASSRAIGPWRLVRPLGAGGMGDVWLVEREGADFRQRAALKLVKRGMDTEAVLARFRRERKVLAELTHPAIPSLIDGGASDDGRPFVVMEYVDGEPLDQFVRTRSLDVAARLRLFVAICDAVQHAHERGVVHRDLKPSNVLVTSSGEPKLLDFGISKVLDAREDSQTIDLTQTGQHMLTPRYASPEQVLGREVTAAADVYALGLMLWELLVGRPAVNLDGLSQQEWIETICERDVPRPSASLDANATSHKRALAGDLDTICAMALRKEPVRRYASVKQLADDVRRHLDAQPVLARADTVTYRVSKFVRRNRVLVGATLAVIVALAVGLVLALLQYRVALRASLEARRSAYSANLEAAEAALRDGDARTASARLAAAPDELRGWEWRHFQARLDGSNEFVPATFEGVMVGAPLTWLDDEASFAIRSDYDLVLWRDGRVVDRIEMCAPTSISYARRTRRLAWCTYEGVLSVASVDGKLAEASVWANDPRGPDADVMHLAVAWSPDERWLALSSRHALRLYDGSSGALVHEFPRATPAAMCAHIAWTPDSRRLARANWEESVDVFDVESLEQLASWRAHTMAVIDLAFDETGQRLATCSLDLTTRIWDFQSRTEQRVIRLTRAPYSLAFFGDELLVGETNGGIRGFDARSGEPTRRLIGHRDMVIGLEPSPSRTQLLSLAGAGEARIWSAQARDGLSTRTCEFVNTVRPSPDSKRFLTSSPDSVLRVWDVRTCAIVCESRLDRGYMLGADWSPDGRWIATAHEVGVVGLWDAESLALERTFEAAPGWMSGNVVFASDSKSFFAMLVAPYYYPSVVRRWSLDGGRVSDIEVPSASRDKSADLVLDAQDAPRLVAGGYVDVDAWRADGAATRLDPFHAAPMTAATANRDRSLFAAAYNDEVLVSRAEDLDVVVRFRTSAADVKALAFHPGETRLAAAVGETVELWDWTVPYRVAVLHGHEGSVSDVAWTPDGSTLLSVSWDGGVRVWATER